MWSIIFRFPIHNAAINWASLLMRLGFGLMMMPHGYGKLQRYSDLAPRFMDFMGLGGHVSLALAIFAEFICALLVAIGLTSRLAVIPLMITMLVAAFVAHAGDPFGDKEHSLLFFTGYLVIFILGPGKYSVDALFRNRQFM